MLDGDGARGLAQAVALQESDAHAGVEVGEVSGQGCASRDDVAQVWAEDGSDLFQHEAVSQAVAHLPQGAGAEGLLARL